MGMNVQKGGADAIFFYEKYDLKIKSGHNCSIK